MIRFVLTSALIMAIGGCSTLSNLRSSVGPGRGINAEPLSFHGIRFRQSSQATSDDRRSFSVTTHRASQNPAAAFEAAQWEAVRYCLSYFGASHMDWPLNGQSKDAPLVGEDDRLVTTGRCTAR